MPCTPRSGSVLAVVNQVLCVPRASSGRDPHVPVLATCAQPTKLPENHILIQVDRFGFSANNVTYQALGESPHFRYFEFHPTPETKFVGSKTHGVTPVWGFGTIVVSTHSEARAGDRVYGYFAPARYVILPVSAQDYSKYAFYVSRPHLSADRRPYNQIVRCSNDPLYDPSPLSEDLTMLYRPLFWTSFWCEDWLFSSSYRGATRILISSASAKTAFCLAYRIKKRLQKARLQGLKVIGLTSKRNLDFTRNLGLYDDVTDYESLDTNPVLHPGPEKWAYVDVAGSYDLNNRVVSHFSSVEGSLVATLQLGLTNLSPSSSAMPGITPATNAPPQKPSTMDDGRSLQLFFTPEWLAVRRKQLSVGQIAQMQAEAWGDFLVDGRDWVRLERIYGGSNVQKAYEAATRGRLGPDVGMIWSMWDGPLTTRFGMAKL